MSAKIFVICLGAVVLASVGCSGTFVSKQMYDRDINQQKEYAAALERDNARLRPIESAYERLKGEADLVSGSNKAYDEIAASLKKALEGISYDSNDVSVDPRTGAIVLGTDLLFFDSGKFDISAKGKEILKKIASANHDKRFRLVGHTDSRAVKTVNTKERLPISDTNLELSCMRATAVAFELLRSGVAERNMTIEGRGATQPRKAGDHKANRRVEIFIVR